MRKCFAIWTITIAATLRGYTRQQILWLLAQSALETGNWATTHWWTDRNLFGMSEMQNAQRRRRLRGVRLGPDGLFRAQFKTLWASAQDRFDWDDQFGVDRGKKYGPSVAHHYHPSSNYASAVDSRNTNDLEVGYWLAIGTLPVIALAILKAWKTF